MARAHDLALATAIRALINDKGLLEVHVHPNARCTELQIPSVGDPPILGIRTTATPEDGKANIEVMRLVAKALGIAKSHVSLERGATARRKVLKIAG